ncbi:signal peptidase I [Candidatus Dojkabacteria bacterium]|nr:signal peptidase I [Candidatus Dojkabacteria bacterium]
MQKNNKPEKFKNFLKETAQTIITSLLLTFFIYQFIARPNQVKGASMIPNIQHNELIFTNQMKHIVSNTALGHKMHWEYKRGEIVIFQLPGYEPYIKRIIALPGENITIQNRKVYINGKLLIEEYLPEGEVTLQGDFLTEGTTRRVPANSYVMLGDNRTNSRDSRYSSVGFVPHAYIIGPAALRILPLTRIGFVHIGDYHLDSKRKVLNIKPQGTEISGEILGE